jgi:hypothetical protein
LPPVHDIFVQSDRQELLRLTVVRYKNRQTSLIVPYLRQFPSEYSSRKLHAGQERFKRHSMPRRAVPFGYAWSYHLVITKFLRDMRSGRLPWLSLLRHFANPSFIA